METQKWTTIIAVFYPFTIVTMAAGFLALAMILLKLDMLLVAAIILWFYFISAASIYMMSKDAFKVLNVNRFFLGFILITGVLALMSTVVLWLGV